MLRDFTFSFPLFVPLIYVVLMVLVVGQSFHLFVSFRLLRSGAPCTPDVHPYLAFEVYPFLRRKMWKSMKKPAAVPSACA